MYRSCLDVFLLSSDVFYFYFAWCRCESVVQACASSFSRQFFVLGMFFFLLFGCSSVVDFYLCFRFCRFWGLSGFGCFLFQVVKDLVHFESF